MILSFLPSRSNTSNALSLLTEIASRQTADSGRPGQIAGILPTSNSSLQDAASKIVQILLEAQSQSHSQHTAQVTVDPTPPEERTSGPVVIGADAVFITGDRQGNRTITTMDPRGTVKTSTAPLEGSEGDWTSLIMGNEKSTTVTLLSDVDIDFVDGSADDEFFAIAGRGNIANVYAGDGDDAIGIMGGATSALGTPKVERVDGGAGDDLVVVLADSADQISGGTGDDFVQVHIQGYGPTSRVDGGDGDDDIHVRSGGIVSDVSGGMGTT